MIGSLGKLLFNRPPLPSFPFSVERWNKEKLYCVCHAMTHGSPPQALENNKLTVLLQKRWAPRSSTQGRTCGRTPSASTPSSCSSCSSRLCSTMLAYSISCLSGRSSDCRTPTRPEQVTFHPLDWEGCLKLINICLYYCNKWFFSCWTLIKLWCETYSDPFQKKDHQFITYHWWLLSQIANKYYPKRCRIKKIGPRHNFHRTEDSEQELGPLSYLDLPLWLS